MRARFFAIVLLMMTVAGCGREEIVEPLAAFRVRILTSGAEEAMWRNQGESVLEGLRLEFGAEATRVSVEDSESRRAALRVCGEEEIDLVICVGSAFEREVLTVAQNYPRTAFVLSPGTVTASNVAVLDFQPFGAAYIGGVVAASQGGNRVGLLVGDGGSWLEVISSGFEDGFRSRFPTGQILRAADAEAVEQLQEASVKVALYAADRLDAGLMEMVEASGIQLIGVGRSTIDGFPEIVVAALSIDLPEAVERITHDVMDGTFRGQTYSFDLGSGVVDLAISPGLQAGWDEDDRERIGEARAAVNAGLVELEHMGF
jgi:basic membrane lipoprotein Med (substrate-binding protein (PBP1-ABC) superfamily)